MSQTPTRETLTGVAAVSRQVDSIYADGGWRRSHSQARIPVVSPVTEEPIGYAPNGDAEDVDRAVTAARRAFDTWSVTSIATRTAFLRRIGHGIESRADELVALLADEVGSPRWFNENVQLGLPLKNLQLAIDAIEAMSLEEPVVNSLVVREPVGVVAAITPWNAPLHQMIAKSAAALAAGCTVVLKPSEVAPLNAAVLAQIVHDAEVPKGVFNVVFGDGLSVGEPLVRHPDVDMVSFTGSVRAGRRVAQLAGESIKKVTLELGGKSATILLPDADIEQASQVVLRQCFANSGQVCSAQTRLLVPRPMLPEVERLLVAGAVAWPVGEPMSPETKLGPLVSRRQFDRVQEYLASAEREGARLILGGPGRPASFDRGFYVAPTIFTDVVPTMTIAREEIFGPVLAVMPYDSTDEAIAIANDVPYGLSGGVWSRDVDAARRVARRLRTGQVIINGAAHNLAAPFGGFGQSGIGRENGRFGVEEFFQLKAIQGGV